MTSECELELVLKNILDGCNIEQKHLRKVSEFVSVVQSGELINFGDQNYQVVYDLCCGNGLLGMYLALKYGEVTSFQFDKVQTTKYCSLRKSISRIYPTVSNQIYFEEADIFDLDLSTTNLPVQQKKSGIVCAIHACGDLTGRVVDIAIKNSLSFAIMPCCHKGSAYQFVQNDRLFLNYIRDQGYSVHVSFIDSKITPKNKVFVGVPNKFT